MNLSLTLFGGAVLVVLMHILLGRVGIANFWRGVISGTTASFVILSYGLIVDLSLDIVAIHLAIFLAAATVMTMISGTGNQSESGGIHWTIKIMAAFFVVLFIVNGAFVSISTNGIPTYVAALFLPHAHKKPVYTGFSGVTRHDEQAASAESQHLKQLSSLRELGWNIEIDGVNQLTAGNKLSNSINVLLSDKNNQAIENAVVKIQFFRAGNEQALAQVNLDEVGQGHYSSQFTIPSGGSWIMQTAITVNGKNIEVDRDVTVKKPA